VEDVSWLGERRLDAQVSSAPLSSAESIRPDTPLAEAIERMLGSGLSVLYVVDERGILVGTVEEMDLVRALIRHT